MKTSLLLFAAAVASLAAEKYTVYETDHFELITDGPRGRAQEILAQFERVRSFFVKTMAMKDPVIKPRIVVFKEDKDYRDYSPNTIAAGHYSALPQRDYIAIGPMRGDQDRRLVVHEYIHLLVRHTDSPMPVWMNEGIAEVYSNIAQEGKVIRVGIPIPEHVFTVRNDWIPLPELVGADHDSKLYNRKQHAGPFYGISWALVHMLVLDPRYKGMFTPLAVALGNGAKPENAFRDVLKKSIEEVETDLKGYIRQRAVNVVNYEVQFDKLEEKAAPRQVTEYEWSVATSDLLMGSRRYDQAAARLEALTNMEAQRPEAWESLAFVRWTNKQGTAEAAFMKARALGSTQPNLGYWAPAFIQDRAIVRKALTETVAKYPAFTDARIRLATQYFYDRDFQAAFDTLKSIGKISRRQMPDWFPIFIQASWYLNKLEESRAAASQFVKLSPTPEAKARATTWFQFAMKDPKPNRPDPVFTAQQTELRPPAAPDDGDFGYGENPNVVTAGRTPLTFSTGALVNLDCKDPAMIHFKTDSGVLKILIDSPTAFQMVGSADGRGELTCGPQSRAGKIGYYPKEGLAGGATAVARSLELFP